MLLNYTLILLIVVLAFVIYKNKEGITNEPPLVVEIDPNVSKTSNQFAEFSSSYKDYCDYFDNGNNVNNSLNELYKEPEFVKAINSCVDNNSDPVVRNQCYADAMTSNGNIEYGILNSNTPHCLDAYKTKKPKPALKYATKTVPSDKSGWNMLNFAATQACGPFNNLQDIEATLVQTQDAISNLTPQCSTALLNRF
jgi:hypothetical protein